MTWKRASLWISGVALMLSAFQICAEGHDAGGAEAVRLPVMIPVPGAHYELGKFKVTQREWQEVMGDNPSFFLDCADCPVERVGWGDIQVYLRRLNARTGRQYRLPTEAEWERACFAGRATLYCGSDDIDAVAWYDKNSDNKTHPRGQKQANGYGLHDMSGNVWEWTSDCADSGCERWILRGGSWISSAQGALAANRYQSAPIMQDNFVGFRLARTLP